MSQQTGPNKKVSICELSKLSYTLDQFISEFNLMFIMVQMVEFDCQNPFITSLCLHVSNPSVQQVWMLKHAIDNYALKCSAKNEHLGGTILMACV
jgi:hypothetical protein